MNNIKPLIIILAAALTGWGCSVDLPSEGGADVGPGELTQSKYNALSDEQKYQVANKLLGTMLKGIPVDEFYDLSNGMGTLTLTDKGRNLITQTREALSQDLTVEQRTKHDLIITDVDDDNQSSVDDDLKSMFDIDFNNANGDWPKHLPLARMYTYPLSKDTFDNWIAYVLANTILFSPAEEIDSASIRDVQKVFDKLREDLRENKSVRDIIARHQRSQENWRRFRSPEDNTREMIEIYLGLFDRDADVPRASIACQNLYLTDEDANYELVSNGFANTEPQFVLDTFVVTCNDFYDVVANHPLVIPRVTTVLVEYFFYTKTGEERAAIVQRIVSGNPVTFQDIFRGILFNEEYLLSNERPKSSEEAFFSTAHQMDWKPYRGVLSEMTSDTNTLSLKQMGWPVLSLKLGRFTGVPLDALSFANYHKGVREFLLLGSTGGSSCGNEESDNRTRCRWSNGIGATVRTGSLVAPLVDDVEPLHAKYEYEVNRLQKLSDRFDRIQQLSVDDYIDYLFMTVLQRRANATENTDLRAIYTGRSDLITDADGNITIRDNRHDEMAQIAFDYMSRLPEYYYFQSIN